MIYLQITNFAARTSQNGVRTRCAYVFEPCYFLSFLAIFVVGEDMCCIEFFKLGADICVNSMIHFSFFAPIFFVHMNFVSHLISVDSVIWRKAIFFTPFHLCSFFCVSIQRFWCVLWFHRISDIFSGGFKWKKTMKFYEFNKYFCYTLLVILLHFFVVFHSHCECCCLCRCRCRFGCWRRSFAFSFV